MSGIVSGAMSGLGAGIARAGEMAGDYYVKSSLQEEAALIQKLRDERLAELKEQSDIRAEERKREPSKRAATKAKGVIERGMMDEDAAGNVTARPHTVGEEARAKAAAYEEEGVDDMASRLRNEALVADRTDQDSRERTLDRGERREDRGSRERHQTVVEQIQRDTLAASREGFVLQPIADGRIAKVFKDGRPTDYVRDPGTGEALSGGKNIPETTKLLVKAYTDIIESNNRRTKEAMPDEQKEIAESNARMKAQLDELLGVKAVAPAASAYKSAEEVKAAFKAGKIDRAAAKKELERFGIK